MPTSDTPLFTANDVATFTRQPVDDVSTVERIVWGWLQPILGIETRPETPAPWLWSAAVELGAIANENPTGLTAYQLGAERMQYSAERRNEILAEVRGHVTPGEGGDADGLPQGCFPDALPEPADVTLGSTVWWPGHYTPR